SDSVGGTVLTEWGRCTAATKIGVPVYSMIPTTNHLESFNCVLKRKFIGNWLRSGKRLRIDLLILILITRILPDIFSRRRTRLEYKLWLTERFREHANGADLVEVQHQTAEARAALSRMQRVIGWWPVDEIRQKSALELVAKGSLASLSRPHPDTYTATCTSSTNSETSYDISLQRSGQASCSCPDFQTNGGACKHLRAVRLVVDALVISGHEQTFIFPTSHLEALQIELPSEDPPTVTDCSLDLPTFQAIGADDTLLGGLGNAGVETRGISDKEEDDDDEESHIEEGYNHEDILGLVTSQVVHTVITTPSIGDQRAAVEHQMHMKLRFELDSLLPRIHGVDNLLSDFTILPADPTQLNELYNVAHSITQRILTLQTHSSNVAATSNPNPPIQTSQLDEFTNVSATTRECTTPPPKRKRRTLFPPSPEKPQIRKSSNGTL
ncbi:hypothetical protein EV360DRAFT_76209, partial [Lentinula raphanica]